MSQEKTSLEMHGLNTRTTANTNDNKQSNFEIKEEIPILGTPFKAVGNHIDGWRGAIGNYLITPIQTTPEGVSLYIEKDPWTVTIALIEIGVDMHARMILNEITERERKLRKEPDLD